MSQLKCLRASSVRRSSWKSTGKSSWNPTCSPRRYNGFDYCGKVSENTYRSIALRKYGSLFTLCDHNHICLLPDERKGSRTKYGIEEDNESINGSFRWKFQSGIAHTASSQSLSIFVDVGVLDNFPSTYRQQAADR